MRGRDAVAVAFRHPDGSIVWAEERLDSGFHARPWSRWPLVRGLVVLYETLVVGTRWLVRGASLAASSEGVELGGGSIAIMLLLALGFGVGIFFLLPLFLASATVGRVDSGLGMRIAEGLIRAVIFVAYLLLIAQAADVRRTFQYHGAEHMTIHALEAGDPLVTERVRRYPTAHPRCGTEFLVVVILVSIVAFSLVASSSPLVLVGSRIVLIPVIVAISYEFLRFAARHRGNRLVRWLSAPGIWVQAITTRQPTDDMIEVAIVSMEQALLADGEPVPAGSADFVREPLDLVEARYRAAREQAEDEAPIAPPAAPPAAPPTAPPTTPPTQEPRG